MIGRRRFNTLLAGTAGWVAAGPLGTAAAQSQPRGAVYASLGARLYRIRRDGDSLVRDPRPLVLPAQVQEGWQHPSGRYFYIASSDQRTSTARVRHHYLNAFRVDSSGDLQPVRRGRGTGRTGPSSSPSTSAASTCCRHTASRAPFRCTG